MEILTSALRVPGDNRPYISMLLGSIPFKSLVDSGANKSILNQSAWRKLSQQFGSQLKSSELTVTSVDGSPQEVLGTVNLPVTYGKRKFSFDFIVMPSSSVSVIVGSDLCRFLNLRVNFAETNISVNQLSVTSAISQLPSAQHNQLAEVVTKFGTLVHDHLTRTTVMSHNIDTGDAKPFRARQYPFSPALMRQLNVELDKMLEDNIISPSTSSWSSPVLMVKKKTGEYRFCFDGRRLNEVTIQDSYPLPRIDQLLSKLGQAKFLSSIDLKSAFWQIPLDEESRPKTAFAVHGRGLFHFNVLAFGLADSPRKMQRLMDTIFGPELSPYLLCYLDDLLVMTSSFEKHIEILNEVCDRLKAANLTVNLDKCKFCRPSLQFLGYVVDSEGLHTDPSKVKDMLEFPRPRTATQVKRFLGLVGWYRRFIPDFSTLSSAITDLIKGKKKSNPINWTEEAEKSFVELKLRLTSAPVLVNPDFDKQFTIQTDASNTGLAAVLFQEIDGAEHPIAFASKTMTSAQRNYTVTEQECLAVLFGIDKFRQFVEGTKFRVVTDHHSLLWLKDQKNPRGRLCRWSIELSHYDFEVEHRKGSLNVVADALSRIQTNVVEFSAPLKDKWYLNLRTKILDLPDQYPLFRVEQERIFRLVTDRNLVGMGSNQWKLVLPKELRSEALKECHDDPMAAHFGISKTLGRLKDLYFWPSMKADVVRHVRACKVCAQIKVPSEAKPGLMGQMKAVSHPFQMLSIDFIGPLPRSRSGNQFILAVSDCFSKFVFLKALPRATSKAVCRFLEEQIFLLFGVPQSIICDNATCFTSREFNNFVESYHVQKIFYNARYHPQHNPVERVNRTIISSISAYLHENHRLWDVHLPKIAQAIRLASHEVTGKSPSFLTFGRLVPTAGNFYGPVSTDPDTIPTVVSTKEHEKQVENLVSVYPKIKERLKVAHQKSSQQYNLRRREVEFSVGDRVWKKNYVLSNAAEHFSAKLAPKYIPGIINKKIGQLVYHIVDDNGKDLGNWHVKDFKPDLTELDSQIDVVAE